MKAPPSIRSRLIVALGLILLAIWLSAAVFTKKTGFAQSRAFLEEQARANANLLLEVVEGQPISPSQLALNQQRVVLLWREGFLKLGHVDQGLSKRLATYQGQNVDTVEMIDEDNWVIAAKCRQEDCAVVAIRDTDRKFAVRRLVASIFFPMFGLFLLGLGAVYLAARWALSPLDALARSVKQMQPTSGAELNDVSSAMELVPVVDAINDMSRRTREHLDREQAFLDSCSHEIRTPLAGLIAQVQSLQGSSQREFSKSTLAHLTFIERSALRASRIANQFLGLAKTRNRVADETTDIRFDVAELVRTMAAEALLEDSSLEISVHGDPQIWVRSDPLPTELVLRNLIENARHHSNRRDLCIRISILRKGGMVVLSIEDNGRGVPTEELSKLGRRFFRGSAVQSPEATGTGLGLSIVSNVAASFDGEVVFGSSRALGGLLVVVHLKLQPSDQTTPNNEFVPTARVRS